MIPPRVSILLPAFDAATTLESCLRSILRQRETRWECVVVNDGSRDATGELACAWARRDPRFRVIATAHRGLVEALNTGVSHCHAPVLARMDADDWMHRDRLAVQLAMLAEHRELDAVGCHVRLFPRSGLREGRLAYESWLNGIRTDETLRRDAFVECPVAHPGLMARRQLFDAFPYRDCDWPEDYDWVLRVLGAGRRIGMAPRRLVGWRDSPGRLSRTHPSYRIERFTACKAAHLAEGFLANSREYLLWGYGHTGRTLRRALAERDRHPSHIVELHPGRIGQRIHGAQVVDPDAIGSLAGRPMLVSVAGAEARGQIRAALARAGWRETRDFLCTA
jgi:glycosyltransferase involved in cell wall biosynthesis